MLRIDFVLKALDSGSLARYNLAPRRLGKTGMGLKNNGLVKFLKKALKKSNSVHQKSTSQGFLSIDRGSHGISRKDFSANAVKVLYRLRDAGYEAYVVGGGVRDVLLKRQPKDFDVATNATPEEVRHVFRNSRIIGRRFRLVHVFFKDEVIEVSTFRAGVTASEEEPVLEHSVEAMAVRSDNTFGTIEEDAWRRDFTINALYYNISNFSVLDFTGGMQDLSAKRLRMIGDPEQRFHEDPVRLLRALRLAAKLDFQIDADMEEPLRRLPHLLGHVPQARIADELIKLFFEGQALASFQWLEKYGYMPTLFPDIAKSLHEPSVRKLLESTFNSTDERFQRDQRLTPGFLFSALLWPAVQMRVKKMQAKGQRFMQAFPQAISEAVRAQNKICLITKRMLQMMRAVWALQYHLEKRRSKRVYLHLSNRYFRAAYDLLGLRAKAGEVPMECYEWWQSFQEAKPKQRAEMVEKLVAAESR